MAHEPTEDQIIARALEVRAGWSLRERRKNLRCILRASAWPDWHLTQQAIGEFDSSADDDEIIE